jgi:hypothetical protein
MDPETCYARNGDVRIAYQVVGEGELDLVFVPAFISNIELTDVPGSWPIFAVAD